MCLILCLHQMHVLYLCIYLKKFDDPCLLYSSSLFVLCCLIVNNLSNIILINGHNLCGDIYIYIYIFV